MVPAQRPAPAGEQTRLRLVPPVGDTDLSRHLDDDPSPHAGEEPVRHTTDGSARYPGEESARYPGEESARHAHGPDDPSRTVEPSAGPGAEPAGWRESLRPASAPPVTGTPVAAAAAGGPPSSNSPVPPEPADLRAADRPTEGGGAGTEPHRPRWAGAFGDPVNRHEEPPAHPDEGRVRHGAGTSRPQQSGWAPPWAPEDPQPSGRRARNEWSPSWYPQPTPPGVPEPEQQPYPGHPERPTPTPAAGPVTGPSYPDPSRAGEGHDPGPTRPAYA
ncbi:hypothetical protein GSF22_25870, partial [Micromonospora echinofusca]|nr:hypothetical protein [Micromonospora echinofusca]